MVEDADVAGAARTVAVVEVSWELSIKELLAYSLLAVMRNVCFLFSSDTTKINDIVDIESNRSGPSGFGGGRATVVKSEPNDISWGGGSGSGHAAGTFGGRAGVKAEQPEELHSDDDLAELPAQDIDNIAYESEEEDDGMGAEEKVNLARNRSQPIHLPVRIHRKQHQDRVVGINTESSTAPAGKVVQTGEPSSSAGSGADGASARKGKKKGKEVEITEVRRPYKGMWQDEEEDEVMVKPEPIDEDGDSLFLPEARPLPATVPRNKGKAKAQKAKRPAAPAAPVLQTEEEKREWERHQAALRALKAELGTKAEPISTEIRDENGDIVMKEGEEGEASTDVPKRSIRDDQVYIFQLPPIMPELVAPAPKPEATDDDSTANDNKNPDSTPIKVEDDPTASNPANKTSLHSGRVGKMRVHESGKVTLEWGGLNFIVNKGIDVSFLQEVVSTKVTPPEERVNEDDGGEAMSFGSVRGKFVVTPDWDDLLG